MSKYRVKHNKKKNTGLIYFTAIKTITEAACGDGSKNDLAKRLTAILVKHLSPVPLRSELEIYKSVVTEYTKPSLANEGSVGKYVDEISKIYDSFDQGLLEAQRKEMVKKISSILPIDEILATRIDNNLYKLLTSTSVLLNTCKRRTINESKDFVFIYDRIVKILLEARNQPKGVDQKPFANKLVLDFLINGYNKKYNDLTQNQKSILREYGEYILNEESNRDFPIKMMTLIERSCKRAERYLNESQNKDIVDKAKKVIERTKEKEQWDTERLVTEALLYSEVSDIILE